MPRILAVADEVDESLGPGGMDTDQAVRTVRDTTPKRTAAKAHLPKRRRTDRFER